jgi:serine/threonine protein kinase
MDVKSSNILLNQALEGKVSDFGISKQHSSYGGDQMTMTLVASQGYMDPEYVIL